MASDSLSGTNVPKRWDRITCCWTRPTGHLAGRYIARGVCGVGVVKHRERVRMAAFCANEYLDFHIKDRIVWLNPFEP